MEIILSKNRLAITGELIKGTGYFIVQRRDRLYGVRSRHRVPKDGHWRFIYGMAALTKKTWFVTDIRVTAGELDDALEEATDGQLTSPWAPRDVVVDANLVLKLGKELGL